jgi:hypothetical protein
MPFQPGRSGNPAGRPKGARDKATQMVDALLFKNVKGIAEVLIREANAGQHWAVKAALTGMLPTRSRRVEEPVNLPPLTTVQEAAERIAQTLSRMEAGAIELDDAARLIGGALAYADARKTMELEIEVEALRATVARLQARVEQGGLK